MERSRYSVMRAVLAVFVVIAIKATIAAKELEEYSQQEDVDLARGEMGDVIKTELINWSGVRIPFRKEDVNVEDALYMVPEGSGSARSIGVKMNNGQKYVYTITRFGVEMEYFPNNPRMAAMKFVVFFQSRNQPNTLLEIPVLQVPKGRTQTLLSTPWPRKDHVGKRSPFSGNPLRSLRRSNQLLVEFKWLSELLQYGIRKGARYRAIVGPDDVDEYYRTRPLLLPKNDIQEIIEEVEHFKYKPEPTSSTASSSRTTDLFMDEEEFADFLNNNYCG